jgi:alpha-tubulin suppressor-like RCC1 family protein
VLSAWGSGFVAQHGDDSLGDHYKPSPVAGFKTVVSISAGRFHSYAVLDQGEVWAFGDPSFGQLGNGSSVRFWTPVKTKLSAAANLVSAGEYGGAAIGSDGMLSTWGDDSRGQLGRSGPDVPHYANEPAAASVTKAVVAASGGSFTIVATE